MNNCDLITLIATIACAITKCCSEDEISILSVSLTQLGDTLATYLTQQEISEKRKNSSISKCIQNDNIVGSNNDMTNNNEFNNKELNNKIDVEY